MRFRCRTQELPVNTPSPLPAPATPEKVFVSSESLLSDSIELAMRIVRSGFRPTFLVALWRGGAPVGIAVQEVLEYHGIHVDHIAIRTSSYTGIDQQAKVVRVHAMNYLISRLSFADQLLIIDDVFDSGRSLEAVMGSCGAVAAAISRGRFASRRSTTSRSAIAVLSGPTTTFIPPTAG